jgi:hypothetical protein
MDYKELLIKYIEYASNMQNGNASLHDSYTFFTNEEQKELGRLSAQTKCWCKSCLIVGVEENDKAGEVHP